MILVDTSVWIDHFHKRVETLAALLEEQQVLLHPWVLGELACGTLTHRTEVLSLLGDLPAAFVASDAEAMALIENHKLMGRGLGWIDMNLIASTLIAEGGSLWTRDKRLRQVASNLGVAYDDR
jgi:predicted nucleic acid-binding protein